MERGEALREAGLEQRGECVGGEEVKVMECLEAVEAEQERVAGASREDASDLDDDVMGKGAGAGVKGRGVFSVRLDECVFSMRLDECVFSVHLDEGVFSMRLDEGVFSVRLDEGVEAVQERALRVDLGLKGAVGGHVAQLLQQGKEETVVPVGAAWIAGRQRLGRQRLLDLHHVLRVVDLVGLRVDHLPRATLALPITHGTSSRGRSLHSHHDGCAGCWCGWQCRGCGRGRGRKRGVEKEGLYGVGNGRVCVKEGKTEEEDIDGKISRSMERTKRAVWCVMESYHRGRERTVQRRSAHPEWTLPRESRYARERCGEWCFQCSL